MHCGWEHQTGEPCDEHSEIDLARAAALSVERLQSRDPACSEVYSLNDRQYTFAVICSPENLWEDADSELSASPYKPLP